MSGNPTLIRQAISNLLQNAIRHNEESGSVAITVVPRESSIAVRVTNTGPFVPTEILESLREPFVRAGGRAASSVPGHGLGLAITNSIAEAHNGRLRLHSNPAGGLTAELELPRDGNRPAADVPLTWGSLASSERD